jgi:thiol-disulfide isomerase/thioredoxin
MKQYTSWIVIGIVVVVLLGGMVWYASRPGTYDTFAGCIKESGATFFGAFWCPHCQEQKALFGKSASKLPYVECSTLDGTSQLPICTDEKIETYPTWEFKDGSRRTGTLSLSELSNLTSCPLITD